MDHRFVPRLSPLTQHALSYSDVQGAWAIRQQARLTQTELNGTKHTFELGAQWTVAEAKQRLAAHLSAHVGEPSHIKLIHAGRILKDTQTIAEYNIQPDDLVVVMTNGGCQRAVNLFAGCDDMDVRADGAGADSKAPPPSQPTVVEKKRESRQDGDRDSDMAAARTVAVAGAGVVWPLLCPPSQITYQMLGAPPRTLKLDTGGGPLSSPASAVVTQPLTVPRLRNLIAAAEKCGVEHKGADVVTARPDKGSNKADCACACAAATDIRCAMVRENAVVASRLVDSKQSASLFGAVASAISGLSKEPLPCAYCHNALAKPCILCEAATSKSSPMAAATDCDCLVVRGVCGCVFHAHCAIQFLRSGSVRCAKCSKPWASASASTPSGSGSGSGAVEVKAVDEECRFVIAGIPGRGGGVPDTPGTPGTPTSVSVRKTARISELMNAAGVNPARMLLAVGPSIYTSRSTEKVGDLPAGCVLAACAISSHSVDLSLRVVREATRSEGRSVLAESFIVPAETSQSVRAAKKSLQKRAGIIWEQQELLCAGAPLDDDWRLGDCLDVMADEQRLTLRQRAPGVHLELFGARHWLPDSLTHDQLVTVLNDSPTVYVVPRCYFGTEPDDSWSKETAFPAAFAADSAWMPSAPQTPRALSCYLSSLARLSRALHKDDPGKAQQLVELFRTWTGDFPPAVTAFQWLTQCKYSLLRAPFRAALSTAFFRLMRQMMSSKLDDDAVFEQTRVFLGSMLCECERAGPQPTRPVTQTVSLECPLSKERMLDPVTIVVARTTDQLMVDTTSKDGVAPLAAAAAAASAGTCAIAIDSVTAPTDGVYDRQSLLDRRRDGKLWRTWQSGPLRDSLRSYEDLKDEQLMPDHKMAALLQAVTGKEAFVMVTPMALAAAAAPASEPAPAAELAVAIGGAVELKVPSLSDGDAAVAAAGKPQDKGFRSAAPLSTSALKDGNRQRTMQLYSATNLMTAPRPTLTRDSQGFVVLYVGRGKEASLSTQLYCPMLGDEIEVDHAQLAKDLGKLVEEGKIAGLEDDGCADDRPPLEGIIFCVDCSNSMDNAFQAEDDDEEEADKDIGGWPKKEISPAAELKITDKEKKALDEELAWFRNNPNFRWWRDLAKAYSHSWEGESKVLLELCKYWMDRSSSRASLVSRFRSRFIGELKGGARSKSSGGKDAAAVVDDDDAPIDFLCPIGRTLMEDPVLCADGFTYERANIRKWFSKYGTSPMTGAKLDSKNYTTNQALKSLIADWSAKHKKTAEVKDKDKSGPKGAGTAKGKGKSEAKEIQLFVKTLTGKTITANVQEDATVEDIARCVLAKEGIPVEQQRLIWAGKQLEFDQTIASYGIRGEATMHLVLRLGASSMPRIGGARGKGEHEKAVTVEIVECGCGVPHRFLMLPSDTIESLKYRFWLLTQQSTFCTTATPSGRSLWKDFRPAGDGFRVGTLLEDSLPLIRYLGYVTDKQAADFTSPLCTLFLAGAHSLRERQRRLTRMETVKQLFHASINRLLAYNLANHVGLVLFGNEARYTCPLTPLYEQFRSVVERADTEGDTSLYDAVAMAADKLIDWGSRHPEAKRRIVCLSDGKDTNSKALAFEVAQKMQSGGIVLDAITIGRERDHNLKGMAKSSGGYCFAPDTLNQAMQLSELETYLNQWERKASGPMQKVTGSYSLREFSFMDNDQYDPKEGVVPERKKLRELDRRVMTLDRALQRADATDAGEGKETKEGKGDGAGAAPSAAESAARLEGMSRIKRIMYEMRQLHKNPHPAFDIYPNEDDLCFWRVVMQGPDGTPYKEGCWCFYVRFGDTYPTFAPEIRFITPVRHVNLNSCGRVCHSILDRNYTPETTIRTIFDCIYGVFLNPDVSDPLDSVLALDYYKADGQYEASIMRHTKRQATKWTRAEWRERLLAEAAAAAKEEDEEHKGKDAAGDDAEEDEEEEEDEENENEDEDDDDAEDGD